MSFIDAFEKLTPEEQERVFLKGLGVSRKKRGLQGKETEDKTKEAINFVRGACVWNSNKGTPLCDKIVCWKGRFLLVECKETHDADLPFSCITNEEHAALTAVEYPHVNGLGLVVIRYVCSTKSARGWVVPYREWQAAKSGQRYKHFDLNNAPPCFRPFWWPEIPAAHERGQASTFERHIDDIFKSRPIAS